MAIAPERKPNEKLRKSNTTIAKESSPVDMEALLNGDVISPKSGSPRVESERVMRIRNGINVPVVLWLALVHAGVLAAPFTFTWEGLALLVGLHWLTGSIGVCLGFHRLLTHGSFKTSRPLYLLISFIGGLAGEGSAIDWVANHRKHHAYSDLPGDPHSPQEGTWWSHMIWLVYARQGEEWKTHNNRWAPDLVKDKGMQFLAKMFLPFQILFGFLLLGLGYLWGGPEMAASFVVWGVFVRLAAVLHTTWFVNSASHIWGYRTYETTDGSRNNWWVALLSYGEGWHNNHHAYPRMAMQGHKWWEIDVTYRVIRLMEMCGLFWDVVDYKKVSDRKK